MPRRSFAPARAVRPAARQALARYRQVATQGDTRTLLGASAVSVVGDWLNYVALIALAYEFGDGALGVGGMLALRLVPGLAFQGFAGALVDRMPGRGLLIATQVAMAGVALSFLSLSVVESIWLLYALVLVLETLNAIARPAFMVQIVNRVDAPNRAAVNGLLGIAMTTAQFVGALIGALLVDAAGTWPLFIINGVTFAAIAAIIARLRDAPVVRVDGDHVATPQVGVPLSHTGASLPTAMAVGGYGPLIARPDIAGYVLLTLAVGILIQGATALFESRARTFDLGEGGGGIFFAAVAVGFLVGGAIAGAGSYTARSTLYLIAGAEAASAVGLALFGLTDSVVVALVALLLTGVAAELAEIPALTYFQHRLSVNVYGRFFSLFLMATAAGGIVGALVGPLLERAFSEGASLVVLAIPCLAAACVLLVIARRSVLAAFPEADAPQAAIGAAHIEGRED